MTDLEIIEEILKKRNIPYNFSDCHGEFEKGLGTNYGDSSKVGRPFKEIIIIGGYYAFFSSLTFDKEGNLHFVEAYE